MDLAAYLVILRRRAIAVILCLVAGGLGGWYAGHAPQKVYEATSRTFVNIPLGRGASLQEALAGTQISSSLIKTYAGIASSRLVAQHIVDTLGLHESAATLKDHISAQAEQDTFIIDITASDQDPQRAKQLADAASTALHDTIAQLEQGKTDPVQAQLIDEAGLPSAPISPTPTKDLALGLILGLLVGAALVAVLEALDRTVKSGVEAERALQAPALALVPRRRGRQRRVMLAADSRSASGEPYRILRTAIRFLDWDNPLRTILVTSPTPAEGKTATAANLAVAFALGGERVAVVDADLRRAQLAEFFGVKRGVGLTSVVTRAVDLSEALQRQPGTHRLDVLPSGPLPPNPSEILGSTAMIDVLRRLTSSFDVVIIDTPPVLPVSDAVALSPHVDAVVMVVRYGRTARNAAAEAARRLSTVGANLVGFVLTSIPPSGARDFHASDRASYEGLPPRHARRRLEDEDVPPTPV